MTDDGRDQDRFATVRDVFAEAGIELPDDIDIDAFLKHLEQALLAALTDQERIDIEREAD